jgi:CubicO group peptidase (beta-lactamase class C family)
MRAKPLIIQAILALAFGACNSTAPQTKPAQSLAEFSAHLEQLRVAGHIHSMSAVIAKDQAIAWSGSFGEPGARPVGDTTVFHLASLTKPFASTVILQLVDEGKVSLDDPVSKYGVNLSGAGTIRVRHLMSHTSEGVPGSTYSYNGNRFSLLDSVIARAAGKPFAEAVQERIIVPLGLKHTAAAPQSSAFAASGLDQAAYLANLVPGYTWAGDRFTPTAYQTHFSTAAGLTSSARDYATFSMAMDRDAFLTPATKDLAYTPVVSPSGETFPYGLGWFTTLYKGVRVIWHYGYWTASSTLVIKIPAERLTFVLLANTDGLSAPYPLGSGRLETSPWAREFLEAFVIAKTPLR